MGIETKTLGILIDELFTTDIKLFFLQEVITNSEDIEEVCNSAKKAQTLNKRRNELIKAIDLLTGFGEFSPSEKTYK